MQESALYLTTALHLHPLVLTLMMTTTSSAANPAAIPDVTVRADDIVVIATVARTVSDDAAHGLILARHIETFL